MTTMKKTLTTAAAGIALLGLTACGSSTGDRALSGAGIGAATDKDDIDLGKPIWR